MPKAVGQRCEVLSNVGFWDERIPLTHIPHPLPWGYGRGAQGQYLPPYAPDLSPIEPCWSKVKTALRTTKARPHEALESALVTVLSTVPPVEARNSFTPWGYTVQETENRSKLKYFWSVLHDPEHRLAPAFAAALSRHAFL